MFLKQKPPPALTWVLLVAFTLIIIANLSISRIQIGFNENISITRVNSQDSGVNAEYRTGRQLIFLYTHSFASPNDFMTAKLRNLIHVVFMCLISFGLFLTFSQFFINKQKAYLMTIFGQFFSLFYFAFILLDISVLLKYFFSQTISVFSSINTYSAQETQGNALFVLVSFLTFSLLHFEMRVKIGNNLLDKVTS